VVEHGFYEGTPALLIALDFVTSPASGEAVCLVARGFYEVRCAFLTTPDFVMPPAGRGCCNEHPLHPRVPGALPPGPPAYPARRPFGGSFPPAQSAFG
jgi:hypothetical protein